MSLLRALNPSLAAQQEALAYERAEGQRNATAMKDVLDSLNAPAQKPVSYDVQPTSQTKAAGAGDILNALTQSPEAKAMQASQKPDMTPLQRQRAMAVKMISSPNKYVQEQGYKMLASYQAAVLTPSKRSASAQIAMDLGLQEGTSEYQDFIKRHSMKSQSINLGGKSGYLSKDEKTQGGLDPNSPFVWGKNGVPQPIKTSGFTEGQQKASGYYDRMKGASKTFNSLEDQGFDATTYQQKVSNLIPLGFGGKFMTADQQKYSTAAIDWARSKLRFESGAVIGDQEAADEAKLYFPQPGDSKEVISLKRQFRDTAEKAMLQASGRQAVSKLDDVDKPTVTKDESPGDNSKLSEWTEKYGMEMATYFIDNNLTPVGE